MSLRIVVATLLAVFLVTGAFAAETSLSVPSATGTPQTEATYDDPLGRSTPQGTVVGFLKAIDWEDDERAVDYLDTRQTGKRARQLALELQQILNQGLSVFFTASTISSKPEGNLNDGFPVNREFVGTVKTKKGEYKILLERVRKENNPPVWLFSSETLRLVPQIYDEIDIPWIEWHLPAVLTENRLGSLPLYRWILPLLLLPLAVFLGWLCTVLVFALVSKPIRRRFDEPTWVKIRRIRRPLTLLFFAVAIYLLSLGSASLLGRLFWTFLASTISVTSLIWIAIHLIEIGADVTERHRPAGAHAVIRLSATLLKALAIIAGLVVIFYYFAGINLTAVVAGLGVGGIAVAFAAQKTIENFFGGVFLVWDKPIRLGDYCEAAQHQGTVEHIGLRSTQIRTLNRTVVFVPNGLLSSISIENFTLRDRFLFQHTLNLRYETPADQLSGLINQIREMLHQHPCVDSEALRVRFIGFGQSSLDVQVFAYILVTELESFLAVQEELLLRIMNIVESGGSGFAFPSQTLYMTRDGGFGGRDHNEAIQRRKDPNETSTS